MTRSQKNNKVARGPGNPRAYPERILVRLAAGTLARLDAVRSDDLRADLIRAALEREIRRRSDMAR